jgi:outer membrane biosynthesis protein TonB
VRALTGRVALPFTGACVAVLLAACGGEKLPGDEAQALLRDLDKVEHGVRAGECTATRPTLRRLRRNVSGLDGSVEPALRTTLDGGVQHLTQLVADQCREAPDPVVAEPEPAPTTPVDPTPDATPTVTQPPPETTEQQEQNDAPRRRQGNRSGEHDRSRSDGSNRPSRPRGPQLTGDGRDPCPQGAEATC